jgi:hypothetical protein
LAGGLELLVCNDRTAGDLVVVEDAVLGVNGNAFEFQLAVHGGDGRVFIASLEADGVETGVNSALITGAHCLISKRGIGANLVHARFDVICAL